MPDSQLSIIIPTLNEAQTLPLLLTDLAAQRGLFFEVIIADGGSTDGTLNLAEESFAAGQLNGRWLSGPSGRGRQLNAGATAASAGWLLFLHADSRLDDPEALQVALDLICQQQQQQPELVLAGRFRLHFDVVPGAGLFYYQCKALLDRPGCTHGDQGMLLSRAAFAEVGPFREDLPVMEDTSLAEAVRRNGRWLLLPGRIITSSRRFQQEGLAARQTLNALLMNFHAIGWDEFFVAAPEVYRQQARTGPLRLLPFFQLIRTLLKELPVGRRWQIWLLTGGYVRSQCWQLGFALDCRRAFRRQEEPPLEQGGWLQWFDRTFDPCTDHAFGRAVTALLVRAWFAFQLLRRP